MADGNLWCVHIIGPDDVHAAPDFDTAERWAVNQNDAMRHYTVAAGMENDPYWPECRAVVAIWPWSAEAHVDGIARSEEEFAKSNRPILLASGIEAPSGGETRSGSTEGESPTVEDGDAQ